MTIQTSDSIKALMTAMLTVQEKVDGVTKDSRGNRSSYASLEAVSDALRQPCLDAHLVITQAPGECIEGTLAVTTMITHADSGEWMRSTLQLPVLKPDPQMAGSTITYARRYSLMALFNLPAVDDDGEAATRPVQRQERQPAPPQRSGAESPPQGSAPVQTGGLRAALSSMRKNETKAALLHWFKAAQPKLKAFSETDQAEFFTAYDAMLRDFGDAA